MCGIAGIWNRPKERDADARVAVMLDAMAHRGPDGRGLMEFSGGAAGMVRLALVDLSDRGAQPFWSDDRRVALIFNGEIYNFRTERERLVRDGYHFHSSTDTEVILALYLEQGLDFVQKLRGMFALAIFDWREGAAESMPVMVLARGPFGVKPLYVAQSEGGGVVFASEIRALLASGLVPKQLEPEAVSDYLAHGFVLQPRTIIAGVRMLEPGTIERYTPDGQMKQTRFWKMPAFAPRNETLDQAAERLRAVLDESIAIHAMADAPVGAFLSGGMDSAGIVGLMRKQIPHLRTYTLRFPDVPGQDESEEAIGAARFFECENTVVDVTGGDLPDLLPRFAADLDQPSNDGLNTWLISRAAAHDVKGVLSGLGADEWFAGYPVARRMARYANTTAGRLEATAGHIASKVGRLVPEGQVRGRINSLATRRSSLTTWLHSRSVFPANLAQQLAGFSDRNGHQVARFEALLSTISTSWRNESPLGLSCLLDVSVYMGSQLLRDSDATSMAHSLELRVPYVDTEVAAFARTCADDFKLSFDGGADHYYHNSGAKQVLVRALRDVLPPGTESRPKRGFTVPFEYWMRSSLSPLVRETCQADTVARRGLVDPKMVAQFYQRAENGGDTLYPKLWSLMMLELWCREVLDKPSVDPKPVTQIVGLRAS
ncbi:MAG: asparagine synthase (glutamine-hydrolyzing) [Acidobacteria bacterium]|nr:asparagine synthase (glutamine-hydrolyzing) [Acidobacteriota bacterium]